MSLNATPSGERIHIGFFGVRNAGKSSIVNAVTGQELSVVSDTLGTTTDPVRKAMELLPAGPVVIIDTPGIDDEGDLGSLRVKKAYEALRKCDVAVLVTDGTRELSVADQGLIQRFQKRGVPFIVVRNKADLGNLAPVETAGVQQVASAVTGQGIEELKELIAQCANQQESGKKLIADLLEPGDVVVLVIPIDSSAPKGRLILPQQMVIRDILDANATCMCCQPEELPGTLAALKEPPKMVVTDSQAFGRVSKDVPESIWLTSFSILMARYKGELASYSRGAKALAEVRDGDKVLISEGCSHHRQCEDIGTVKMPNWIRNYSNSQPEFSFTSGNEFPDDLSEYKLVVHCGACMLNEREVAYRVATAAEYDVPMVNYGMAIAQMHGILERSLQPFC